MKTLKILLAFYFALSVFPQAVSAGGGGGLTVKEEVKLQAKAQEVWEKIGQFGALDKWHPAVASTRLIGSGQDTGDARILTLGDGSKIMEVLVDYEQGKSYCYVIMTNRSGPLPVKAYHAELRIKSRGKRSKVTWKASFDSKGVDDEAAREAIRGVFQGGFSALEEMFNK